MFQLGTQVKSFNRSWPNAAALLSSVVLLTGLTAAAARAQEDLTDDQREDIGTLVALVDGAMASQKPLAGPTVGWHNDFLKALESKTYVPFSLTIAENELEPVPTLMYVRVVQRVGVPPGGVPSPVSETTEDEPMPTTDVALGSPANDAEGDAEFDFEDVHFLELRGGLGRPYRATRAFAVPAGEYDVYVALLQHGSESDDPTTVMVRQPLTVPDYWAGELATSTLILAERVEPIEQPLDRDQQAAQPYTFGTMQIVPALEPTFTKADDLSILFLVYNPDLGNDEKPDIVVDYTFHKRTGSAEEYFNKTHPQSFNSETLPVEFDLAGGHQLVAGQSVPLAMFPAGDYRLEINVTDRNSGMLIQRDVEFTVTDS